MDELQYVDDHEYIFDEEGAISISYDDMETILFVLDMYLDACEESGDEDEYAHVDSIAQKVLQLLSLRYCGVLN